MSDTIVEISDDFWNVRGTFKLAGLIDIGTQCSLVRLRSGSFVILDSYLPSEPILQRILQRTEGGKAVSAILNLHPFHTVHVEPMAKRFPKAKLYGTRRHVARAPQLKWEPIHTEDPELAPLFADDLEFSVPPGVDFIPSDEKLHFSSVLAFHPASRTLHVDDTLLTNPLPLIGGGVEFHMTFAKVLQQRPGAAEEFRGWARELIERCREVEHLCTAHGRSLPPTPSEGHFAGSVQRALDKLAGKLAKHERRYG
ncbi:MAG: hypothetical protein KC431_25305 [Myxococcales bacterium]|nr:hypothetical protein [Myxococcales bacterium]